MKKTLLILTLFATSIFTNVVFAQSNTFTFNNTSNCSWTVQFLSGLTPLGTFNAAAMSSNTVCLATFTGSVTTIHIYDAFGCAVTWPASGGTQGGITAYCTYACAGVNTTDSITATASTVTCSLIPYNWYHVDIVP